MGGGAAGAAGFRESISVQIFTDPVTGATLPCEKAANQAFGRYQDVGLMCGGRFISKDLTCIAQRSRVF